MSDTLTAEEAKQNIGALVRIAPQSTGHKHSNRCPHWNRGKLMGVRNDRIAIVQIFSHRRPENVELRFIKIWKSRTQESLQAKSKAMCATHGTLPD